jgi:excisionase family DNA binding protein
MRNGKTETSSKLLLRAGEIARILSVCEETVGRMCRSGQLKFTLTPGRHRRIFRDSLEEYLGRKLTD